MGLFDSIAGNVLGSVLGGNKDGGSNPLGSILGAVMGSGNANPAQATDALGGLLNAAGGVTGLLQKAQQMGLGDVVGSWVGSGANKEIGADQVGNLLGNDAIQAVASKFGINVAQAGPLIAAVLPTIIDKLTPKGEANDAEHGADGIQGAVAGLLQGGGLTSILGGLMGGKA